jgi:hypothetical protein
VLLSVSFRSPLSMCLLVCLSSTCTAQPQRGNVGFAPPRRPSVSPYVNLLSRNVGSTESAAISYYGIVRPEVEFRAAQTAQRAENQRLQREVDTARQSPTSLLGPTGHRSGFQTHDVYFRTSSVGQGRAR